MLQRARSEGQAVRRARTLRREVPSTASAPREAGDSVLVKTESTERGARRTAWQVGRSSLERTRETSSPNSFVSRLLVRAVADLFRYHRWVADFLLARGGTRKSQWIQTAARTSGSVQYSQRGAHPSNQTKIADAIALLHVCRGRRSNRYHTNRCDHGVSI